MKRRMIFLYTNRKYKILSEKKTNKAMLKDRSLYRILIPLDENPSMFFPLRPNSLYDSYKYEVTIRHAMFSFDMDNDVGNNWNDAIFTDVSYNIIDFGNAIYNLYKFYSISEFLERNASYDFSVSFALYPREVILRFYDESDNLIEEINSGDMGSLYLDSFGEDLEDSMDLEDRFNIISQFTEGIFTEEEDMIDLYDNTNWIGVRDYENVNPKDYLLIPIENFSTMYLINSADYDKLDESDTLKKVYARFACGVVFHDTSMDPIDTHNKIELLRAIDNNDVYKIVDVYLRFSDAKDFFIAITFTHIILTYIKYFVSTTFQEDCIVLAVFEDDKTIMKLSECKPEVIREIYFRMLR